MKHAIKHIHFVGIGHAGAGPGVSASGLAAAVGRDAGSPMKHAIKHIRFVGIGHAGAGAPAFPGAALPLPPGATRVRR